MDSSAGEERNVFRDAVMARRCDTERRGTVLFVVVVPRRFVAAADGKKVRIYLGPVGRTNVGLEEGAERQ